jgi:nucleotide-binding universal stress UspA family protein
MKVLFACDGSQTADAIAEEMLWAGMPKDGKALVLCVGQAGKSQDVAEIVRNRIRPQVPAWEFSCEALTGAPQDVLPNASRLWRPDLLIMGAGPHSDGTRMHTPDTSLEVARQVDCSVRAVRSRKHRNQGPIRLLIGHDGSRSANAIASALNHRSWPPDTEARIVSVVETSHDKVNTAFLDSAKSFASRLRRAGLHVDTVAVEGDPRRVLFKEAERFNADSIFVGARDPSGPGRFLMGSVSTAVWNQARCPIELVR